MEIFKEVSIIMYKNDIENLLKEYFKKKKIQITDFGLPDEEIFASLKGIQFNHESEVNYNRGYFDINTPHIENVEVN